MVDSFLWWPDQEIDVSQIVLGDIVQVHDGCLASMLRVYVKICELWIGIVEADGL